MDTDVNVSEIRIDRGRQGEFAKTDTGTAEIDVNDIASLLDPLNAASIYYDKLVGKQTAVSEWDPVELEWKQQFQGVIDEITFNVDPSGVVTRTTVRCVDRFDYLASIELVPGGSYGDALPAAADSDLVFYDNGAVDDRIIQLLTDAGVGASQQIVFSGNVTVTEDLYDAGDDLLGALWDAVDAEWPGLANCYCDKWNRVTFHGRLAKLDPDSVSTQPGVDWPFTRWKAGDGVAILADSTRAQIRPPLTYTFGRKHVINAALCAPKGIDAADMAAQLVTDAASITKYGVRAWSRLDLHTLAGTTTGDNANDETKRFATFYVQNQKDMKARLEQITFKSLYPDDSRAAATWALMLGVEISDCIDLETTGPGAVGGFDESFFVEGIHKTIRPGGSDWHYSELTVDLSPESLYTYDAFA